MPYIDESYHVNWNKETGELHIGRGATWCSLAEYTCGYMPGPDCASCGNNVFFDDLKWFEGFRYCEECYNRYIKECGLCGETFRSRGIDQIATIRTSKGTQDCCDSCLEHVARNPRDCVECKAYVLPDDLYRDSATGLIYCTNHRPDQMSFELDDVEEEHAA